jgi:hypothetical protein
LLHALSRAAKVHEIRARAIPFCRQPAIGPCRADSVGSDPPPSVP